MQTKGSKYIIQSSISSSNFIFLAVFKVNSEISVMWFTTAMTITVKLQEQFFGFVVYFLWESTLDNPIKISKEGKYI